MAEATYPLWERLHSLLPTNSSHNFQTVEKYLSVSSDNIKFSLEEYYKRVGTCQCEVSGSTLITGCMNMVNSAITTGLKDEILNDLPAEFAELFGQEPTTPLSPTVME